MVGDSVNRDLQLSHVLSVRLTPKQWTRVQVTFRNFGISGSTPSEQLREFLRLWYWRSVRYARERERIQRDGERERERFYMESSDPEEGDLPCFAEGDE